MKNDNYDDQEFLPINPGEDFGGIDKENYIDEFEEFTIIEEFCESIKFEKKLDFLKSLGYKIKERTRQGQDFLVVLKPGERKLPNECNIDTVFQEEVENSILNILLKYGRK